uniref:Uncharacterized protein n=1 Tax=Magnetococcus massalia (strain MO-1) TaxID=451514 RepID=A0A1S7LKM9_MAGMO|nr:protein of unknown function [Candidatus Magnetococcus massalia]
MAPHHGNPAQIFGLGLRITQHQNKPRTFALLLDLSSIPFAPDHVHLHQTPQWHRESIRFVTLRQPSNAT